MFQAIIQLARLCEKIVANGLLLANHTAGSPARVGVSQLSGCEKMVTYGKYVGLSLFLLILVCKQHHTAGSGVSQLTVVRKLLHIWTVHFILLIICSG